MVLSPNVKISPFLQNPPAAGDADYNLLPPGSQLLHLLEQGRQAGVNKHSRLLGGPGWIQPRIRQQGVEQAAGPGQRVINGDAQPRPQGPGAQDGLRIAADGKLRQPGPDRHDKFRWAWQFHRLSGFASARQKRHHTVYIARFGLNLQGEYDLRLARQEKLRRIEKEVHPLALQAA
jgi:hypothetical protein